MAAPSTGLPKLRYTQDLTDLLNKMGNDYISFEMLRLVEEDDTTFNGLKISLVDISKRDWCFDVVINNKITPMKIGQFIRYYLGNEGVISSDEIYKFSSNYNKVKNGEPQHKGDVIKVEDFKFNPRDVRSTFLSMVTKTYPHGHEKEVVEFLPKGLNIDKFGNYYKIIGKSNTMFTSHLDTADRHQDIVTLISVIEKDEEYILTDGTTILGADDKSGVAIMLYMMDHNIPGLYYFFIGEERGGIGSGQLSSVFSDMDYLKDIKKCISFDRRNYHSVITHQMGRRCCSDQFGTALCKSLSKNGLKISLDTTGIYTDSASFIDDISECTNISVGYFHEHTGSEYQNMTFLKKISEVCITVDWESLPSVRKVGLNQEILAKYGDFIKEFKQLAFANDFRIAGEEGKVYIRFDVSETDVDSVHDDLILISFLFKKHKMDPDIIFVGTELKIELR